MSPELLLDVFRALPAGIVVTRYDSGSHQGVVLAANPAAGRILGIDFDPLIGGVGAEVVAPLGGPETELAAAMAREVADSGVPRVLEHYTVGSGPLAGQYEAALIPLGDRCVMVVFRRLDIEIEARRSFEWALRAMDSSAGRLDRLATSVAHDLKNPLAGIRGSAELLGMVAPLEGPAETFRRRILELTDHGTEMIDAAVREARSGPTGGLVDLGAEAEWVVDLLAERIDAVGAEVVVGPLPTVRGHRSGLRQVLLNLVDNALRYRHPRRSPSIRIEEIDPGVVAVVDNGRGVPPADRERIFRWDVRGGADTDPIGHGVGLAACRSALAAMGAEVRVGEPPAGGGTTMLVTFGTIEPTPT